MQLTQQIKVPGKVTLTGEHAVIYGAQGLAAPINRYCYFKLSRLHYKKQQIHLYNYQIEQSFKWNEINMRAKQLDQHLQAFRNGSRTIKQVCDDPLDLMIACLNEVQTLCPQSQNHGHHLWIQSEIPQGLGLGSSAAVIVGILRIFCQMYNITYDNHDLEARARRIEHLQHGYSSGIDITTCNRNRAWHFGQYTGSLNQAISLPIHFINTGQSGDSTGQCVSIARQYWNDARHLKQFNQCTTEFITAINTNKITQAHQAIRTNHRLLCELGVVPNKVQHFIKNIENQGFSAKICGSGGVSNDCAGIIMVLGENINKLSIKQEPYSLAPFHLNDRSAMVREKVSA